MDIINSIFINSMCALFGRIGEQRISNLMTNMNNNYT